jgi:replication factor A1
MGEIDEVYEDLEADVSLAEFRDAVEEKVSQMGGLADEETAAMLVAHEYEGDAGGEVEAIADVEPGMEEVKFLGKVVGIGDVRTFERDGEDDDGRVVNVEMADESGSIRCAFWDEQAAKATEQLHVGDVLRVKGRPKDGYNGVEVSVDRVEGDQDADVDVQIQDSYRIEDLSLGLSDVNCKGVVLDTESVRTFDRDDGSEGKVANLTLGDPTGRLRVTLWDEMADRATELSPDATVEVVDGYSRERDGDLELHVGEHGAVEELDETVEYTPDSTPIDAVEIGQTVDLVGVVRSADPKRTFDRDDGSEGQVRNVRVQDDTADIRVALWGEKADRDLQPGDRVAIADVEIEDGWQDDLEASANWRSTVTVLQDGGTGSTDANDDRGTENDDAGLGAFTDESESETADETSDDVTVDGDGTNPETVEFVGTVVQAGDPVVLDDGDETLAVETDADLFLGQEVTVRGRLLEGGRMEPDDLSAE